MLNRAADISMITSSMPDNSHLQLISLCNSLLNLDALSRGNPPSWIWLVTVELLQLQQGGVVSKFFSQTELEMETCSSARDFVFMYALLSEYYLRFGFLVLSSSNRKSLPPVSSPHLNHLESQENIIFFDLWNLFYLSTTNSFASRQPHFLEYTVRTNLHSSLNDIWLSLTKFDILKSSSYQSQLLKVSQFPVLTTLSSRPPRAAYCPGRIQHSQPFHPIPISADVLSSKGHRLTNIEISLTRHLAWHLTT